MRALIWKEHCRGPYQGPDIEFTFECAVCHEVKEGVEFNAKNRSQVWGWCCNKSVRVSK